jgi:hypothetical protein
VSYFADYQIEIAAERKMNMLDRALMRGDIDQAGYDLLVYDLKSWADQEYAKLKRKRILSSGL